MVAGMTITDLLLLAVIGVSALFGVMRGFVGALASLAAWVLAGWAAFRFGAKLALVFAGGGEPGPTQLLAGYGLSFLGVMIFVGLIGWVLRKLVQTVGLSGVDRALGAALGLARGGFVACVLVLLMGFTAMPHESGWHQSRVVPVLLPGAQWMRGWLPGWAAAQVDFGASTPHSIDTGNALALPQPGA
jgi:membrane protein required for colicin V production